MNHSIDTSHVQYITVDEGLDQYSYLDEVTDSSFTVNSTITRHPLIDDKFETKHEEQLERINSDFILTAQERMNFKMQIRMLLQKEELEDDSNQNSNESVKEKNVKILHELMKSIHSEPTLIIKKPSPKKQLPEDAQSVLQEEANDDNIQSSANMHLDEAKIIDLSVKIFQVVNNDKQHSVNKEVNRNIGDKRYYTEPPESLNNSTCAQESENTNTTQDTLITSASPLTKQFVNEDILTESDSTLSDQSNLSEKVITELYARINQREKDMKKYSFNNGVIKSLPDTSSLNGSKERNDSFESLITNHVSEYLNIDQDDGQTDIVSPQLHEAQVEYHNMNNVLPNLFNDANAFNIKSNIVEPVNTNTNKDNLSVTHLNPKVMEENKIINKEYEVEYENKQEIEDGHEHEVITDKNEIQTTGRRSETCQAKGKPISPKNDSHHLKLLQANAHPENSHQSNVQRLNNIQDEMNRQGAIQLPFEHQSIEHVVSLPISTISTTQNQLIKKQPSYYRMQTFSLADNAKDLQILYNDIGECNYKYQEKHQELLNALSTFSRHKYDLKMSLNRI